MNVELETHWLIAALLKRCPDFPAPGAEEGDPNAQRATGEGAVSSGDGGEDDDSLPKCQICVDRHVPSVMKTKHKLSQVLPCGHQFHKQCIGGPTCRNQQECPTCGGPKHSVQDLKANTAPRTTWPKFTSGALLRLVGL